MLDYWLRMAGATFGSIGRAAALAYWKPQKFQILIQLFPAFHGFLGVVLLISAFRNGLHLPAHTSFPVCFAVALLIQLPLLFGRGDVEF
jgi:succinate dehydrogenase/fumarate reductase cytochrome b subunit